MMILGVIDLWQLLGVDEKGAEKGIAPRYWLLCWKGE